jgi:hypothetical protein
VADKTKLECFLLRYVPDAVKGEFVNFGVATFQNDPKRTTLIDVRFTRDWGRVLCLDPQADVEVLAALQRELQQEIGKEQDQAALMKRMRDSFSGVVQLSPVMPALTEKAATEESDAVARIFLETAKIRRTREPAGRQRILETMRNEFERAGVLKFLHPVPTEPYTKVGDPFEFDFGYRVGSEVKLFHAVSMRTGVDTAVTLAARYPKIGPAMAQLTATTPLLTAVVEAELDRSRSEVGFALEMMEESRIRVAPIAELPGIADVARRELGA